MRNIVTYYPSKIEIGAGCIDQLVNDYIDKKYKRIFICTIEPILELIKPQIHKLKKSGIETFLDVSIINEPDYNDFDKLLSLSKTFNPDSILAIGGGSVLDTAKLLATLTESKQTLAEIIGNGLVKERKINLVCCPTTSGTGSEVSPNSILIDSENGEKKGIISPFLVPDAAYIDPNLTLNLPPNITAYTGIDAFTHCLEAYINVNAHPFVDAYAIKGISIIYEELPKAVVNGKNIEARSKVALGSMLGGMCLGPVNTAAIHALAYPLGSKFKIGHGLSNAVLLPAVVEYNISQAPERYAEIARAIGVTKSGSDTYVALSGLQKIKQLLSCCDIPASISKLGITKDDIPTLAKSAMNVKRLLVNNPRKIELEDAIKIYENSF